MTMGYIFDESLTDWCPATSTRHVGLASGLVDEDQSTRVQPRLLQPPVRPTLSHVGPVLLGGMNHFFLKLNGRDLRCRSIVERDTDKPLRSKIS